ncbi:MAG: hypothetical protein HN348_35930, partial [Proteobacteria bacterium]|nr:hypothetical protein [Pseudomonadota bacterium]
VAGDACEVDDFEPNDSYQDAFPLAEGSYPNVTLCVGDNDWFTLELHNGEVLDTSILFDQDESDLGLRLYKLNDDGTMSNRANADTLTADENLIYQPYDDGTFLLYVYRSRGTKLANYSLSLSIEGSACIADAYEENDSYPDATSMMADTYPDLTLCVGDADWYQLNLANGETIQTKITFEHDDNDLGLTVYKLNDDGTTSYRTGSNTLTDNESITYQPFDEGTFLIYVYRSRGTTVASYTMEIDILGEPCTPDSFEPNDAAGEAAVIADDTYEDLTLCVGDFDWYSVEVSNGELIDVAIEFEHDDNDLGMQIYKDNGDGTYSSRRSSDTLTDNESLIYQPYDEGTFLIQVYRSRGTTVAT